MFPYQSVVGALTFLAVYTKPDIAYTINLLSRFNTRPTYAECQADLHTLLTEFPNLTDEEPLRANSILIGQVVFTTNMAVYTTTNSGNINYGRQRHGRLCSNSRDCVDARGDDRAWTQRLPAQLGCYSNKLECAQHTLIERWIREQVGGNFIRLNTNGRETAVETKVNYKKSREKNTK